MKTERKTFRAWLWLWRLPAATILAVSALGLPPARAEAVRLVSGDFPPFVIEQGARHGVVVEIVEAAFAAVGATVQTDYLPWKRGYLLSEKGDYLGTFPYARNPERETAFYYSDPLYVDHMRLFGTGSGSAGGEWRGKRVCVPIGYDLQQISSWLADKQPMLERPPQLEDCFRMLASRRVDGIPLSEAVGVAMIARLYGDHGAPVQMLDGEIGRDITYLVISRKRTDGLAWLKRFNQGLAVIRKNGSYDKLLLGAH